MCLLIINEGTDTDCPVEFQVNYTLNFTKYSSECKPLTFRHSSDLLFFLYDLYTDGVNGEDENILHVVTVDECEETKCVDLKTVFFYIPLNLTLEISQGINSYCALYQSVSSAFTRLY